MTRRLQKFPPFCNKFCRLRGNGCKNRTSSSKPLTRHMAELFARNTGKDPASTRVSTISSLQLQKGWIYDKNKAPKRKTPETANGKLDYKIKGKIY
jgi:hypothetical protein